MAELGLEAHVRLLGQRSDLPRLLAACDVVASCSRSEAFSNVIGEAMACGIPCAVTDVGDSAFVVGDAGIVVPAGDPEAMSNAWLDLLADAIARSALGLKARRRVVNNFSMEMVAPRYVQVYEELLSPE